MVAIIAILAAMLLPALNAARERAKSAQCTSNLKQVGVMSAMYSNTFDDYVAPHSFTYVKNSYGNHPKVSSDIGYPFYAMFMECGYAPKWDTKTKTSAFICPSSSRAFSVNYCFVNGSTYGITLGWAFANGNAVSSSKKTLAKLSKVKNPAGKAYCADSAGGELYEKGFVMIGLGAAATSSGGGIAYARHGQYGNVLSAGGSVSQLSRADKDRTKCILKGDSGINWESSTSERAKRFFWGL